MYDFRTKNPPKMPYRDAPVLSVITLADELRRHYFTGPHILISFTTLIDVNHWGIWDLAI
jgi:hypothetical protein